MASLDEHLIRVLIMIMMIMMMILSTRLTYNCAHLRSTKETLTIEYLRTILEKKMGENFTGENFWGENCLGENSFCVKFFG